MAETSYCSTKELEYSYKLQVGITTNDSVIEFKNYILYYTEDPPSMRMIWPVIKDESLSLRRKQINAATSSARPCLEMGCMETLSFRKVVNSAGTL